MTSKKQGRGTGWASVRRFGDQFMSAVVRALAHEAVGYLLELPWLQ